MAKLCGKVQTRAQPKKYGGSKLALLILTSLLAVATGNVAPSKADDDDLGVIPNQDTTGGDFDALAKGSPPVDLSDIALSDTEQRRKSELASKYSNEELKIHIDSISPAGGPTTGETRVLVRGGPFKDMNLIYPHPKCKFGRNDMIVDATYVSCTEKPLTVGEIEGKHAVRDDECLQCESSPPSTQAEVVSLIVSMTGDFTDCDDSITFRYYAPPKIDAIYPRYGKKDGDTLVEVWGQNFMNFDYQLRCGFGSKTSTAHFISSTYMTCLSPQSEVTAKPIPFSVSMNGQQNTLERIDYWYYSRPIVSALHPNYGLDQGGNIITLKGSNFKPFDWSRDIDNRNDTFCYFEQEDVKMPMTVLNSTIATCEVPPNVMHVDSTFVEVGLNNRDWSDDNVPYFYYRPSRITNIEPKEGPTRGNTTVMVFGIDFTPGKKIICKWGDVKTRGKFISMSQIKCLSPPWTKAQKVPLAIAYEGEDSKFQSESFDFLYYQTPVISGIEPTCGPVTGYTQITVKGKNFVDMGFGKVKCLFNETATNATIINSETLKCSSPRLSEEEEALDTPYLYAQVRVTLNGRETTLENEQFNYYPELKITEVQHNVGPIQGGTISTLLGENFDHPNTCNIKVRYGALEVTPKLNHAQLTTISPKVSIPDAVTLSPSGNGQNYAPDYILHYRDVENTFTYIQDIFVEDMEPESGPSTGGTKISVRGYGIQQLKFANGTVNIVNPLVRFVDAYGSQVGNATEAQDATSTSFKWFTPVSSSGTHCTMQISYNNGGYWQSLLENGKDHSFVYYTSPIVESIKPRYGPVKISVTAIIQGSNFECPDSSCSNLMVRFGSEKDGTSVPGKLLSSSQIEVLTPAYTKPDVLPIEISFNGVDFTNSKLTYGYFDPFIIRVQPNLVTQTKASKLLLHGFGFIDPDNVNDIKVKFTSPKGELTCNGQSPCVVPATYIDKNTVSTNSLPMSSLAYPEDKPVQIGDPIFAEVTLVGNLFTDNKIPFYYHEDPVYNKPSRDSVPNNLQQPIIIDTDFHWPVNNVDQFEQNANFTCLFQVGDERVVTLGRLETVPFGAQYDSKNTKPTHVACSTPDMHNSGKGTLRIAPNGQDYTGAIDYEFQAPLDLYRVLPQCGPLDGTTQVKLMGSGFSTQKDAVFSKFGTIAVKEIEKSAVQSMAWHLQEWLSPQLMNEGDLRTFQHKDAALKNGDSLTSIVVEAPKNPQKGGPVYVSVGQHVDVNQIDTDGRSNVTQDYYFYTNSMVEYYYYKSPQVKKVEPLSGLTEGGTPIEISGAWFDNKLQYGLVPHCKIGDKVVRAIFHSTVRLVCMTPPSENTYSALPVRISQNGVDWVDTGFSYSYYHQATIQEIFPRSGQMNGGTELFIHGENFSNITNPETTKCRWTLIDNASGVKRARVIQFTPAFYVSETQMMCVTPSSFVGGDRAFVQITFNGKDFSAQDEKLIFQFYSILGSFPHSGPSNAQNEVILVRGAGFKQSAVVFCSLNKTEMPPVEVTENRIKCPMVWPGKDHKATGSVKFGISFDGSWTDFGNFYYYQQIELDDVYPRYGPADGHGIITLYGAKFRDDFPMSELGCKVGDNVGQGQLIDQNTVRCVVEHLDLVNQGENLPVYIALNSYSWVGEKADYRRLSGNSVGYVPYGIQSIFPESGIIEGFTDIFITGKGFTEDIADKAKCRFGVDGSYQIVDAAVMDYTKLVCRSPAGSDFTDIGSSSMVSVPFSIAFGEQENKPWTQDLHRFRFYTQPYLGYAVPDEINVRKKTEIFVVAEDGYSFIQPVPAGRQGMSDYHGTGGVSCSFGDFGTSMGMYLNQTTMLCLSPHISGTSDDYSSETVTVAIAMNGQDFMESTSNAEVTFVGTGSSNGFFHFVIGALLIALLLLALLTCIAAVLQMRTANVKREPEVLVLRNNDFSQPKGYNMKSGGASSQGRRSAMI